MHVLILRSLFCPLISRYIHGNKENESRKAFIMPGIMNKPVRMEEAVPVSYRQNNRNLTEESDVKMHNVLISTKPGNLKTSNEIEA
jgi:hypothetical protein